MKKILILMFILSFVSFSISALTQSGTDIWMVGTTDAGAVLDSDGSLTVTADLVAQDDLTVTDDASIGGDLALTGDLTLDEITASTATITYTVTAGTLTDGTASITGGAGSGFGLITASSVTVTNTATAGTLTDGTASLTSGALTSATNVATSSATVTYAFTLGASETLDYDDSNYEIDISTDIKVGGVIGFSVNIDTSTAPKAVGFLGIDSSYQLYMATGTSAGQWQLVGSQS